MHYHFILNIYEYIISQTAVANGVLTANKYRLAENQGSSVRRSLLAVSNASQNHKVWNKQSNFQREVIEAFFSCGAKQAEKTKEENTNVINESMRQY